MDRESRFCKYCLNLNNTYVVENLYHFIMSCPLYENIRRQFIPGYCNSRPAASFIYLISSRSKLVLQNLSGFTFHAFKLTKVFFKPTETPQPLHNDSLHPKHTVQGILTSQISRFFYLLKNYQFW